MQRADHFLKAFIEEQSANGKSVGTLNTYRRIIQDFRCWLDLNGEDIEQLNHQVVQSYFSYLENKGNSASTIQIKYAALSAFLQFLGCSHILQDVIRPMVGYTKNIVPRTLDRNEQNWILQEVERSRNLRNIAIVYMFLYTGLRVSEMVALNRDDIKDGEQSYMILVRKANDTFTRRVPLPVEAWAHLSEYINNRKDEDHALFLSNYRRRITIRSVQRILEKYGVHSCQLRHTYCKELIGAGVDLATIAELAGHTNVNVTRRYIKQAPYGLEQTIAKTFD